GMSVVSVEKGQVSFGLDVGEHLYNPIGSVHGGVFCTLLDSAMGCAVHSSLDRGQAYTTLELKVNIVKALTLSTPGVVATGQVVSAELRRALDYVLDFVGPGFTVERFESGGKPSALVYPDAERREFHVILNAHLDVVPAPPDQFRPRREGDLLFARGAQDMKVTGLLA